ncbi:AlpA family transcriptional regulator [Vibrio sp. 1288]|uniref:helix-turn-helix transcriptional regulator n=1 Tax=Vibrio sp. 1288 TaxID=3074550 RepID=UPI002966B758|nr:AlpA family transcriptional regulator [Vibrio sp. 1288]MDW3136307.1 AlpA family transcriptional regulator [Vibrio sp. 1288]
MRLIRLKEVLHKVGVSKATLYRLIAAGEFPQSINIASRAVAWEESQVDEYLMRKVSEQTFKREQQEAKMSPHYVNPERLRMPPILRY